MQGQLYQAIYFPTLFSAVPSLSPRTGRTYPRPLATAWRAEASRLKGTQPRASLPGKLLVVTSRAHG